jgi:hypothetical protein
MPTEDICIVITRGDSRVLNNICNVTNLTTDVVLLLMMLAGLFKLRAQESELSLGRFLWRQVGLCCSYLLPSFDAHNLTFAQGSLVVSACHCSPNPADCRFVCFSWASHVTHCRFVLQVFVILNLNGTSLFLFDMLTWSIDWARFPSNHQHHSTLYVLVVTNG